MKTLLYIGYAGPQYWEKTGSGWQAVPGAGPKSVVWALTDLAEESVSELALPRMFGRDRGDFVARQLASRFAGTPFRLALPPPKAERWKDRLFPQRQTLLAVDAADRITAALDANPQPLAGLWCSSQILAQLATQSDLPTELFVVAYSQDRLRILFLRQGELLVTRLVAVAEPRSPAEMAAEVQRTLRHLENTRVLDRSDQRVAVLLLGGAQALAGELDPVRLAPLQVPASLTSGDSADFKFLLFDHVLRQPAGQLAPTLHRSSFIAGQLRRVAYGMTAITVLLASFFGALEVRNYLGIC